MKKSHEQPPRRQGGQVTFNERAEYARAKADFAARMEVLKAQGTTFLPSAKPVEPKAS